MSLPSLVRKTVPVIDPKTGKPCKDSDGNIMTQRVVYVNPAKRYVKPFWLTTDPSTVPVLGNGNSGLIPLTLDSSDGHFEVFYIEYESTGGFTFQIFDEGRRTLLMNRPIHIVTAAGIGRRPFVLPETLFLNVARGNRQLSIIFYDISGAPNNIRFSLVGRRFIYKDAPVEIFKQFTQYYEGAERSNVFFLTTTDPLLALVPATARNFEFRIPSDSFFEIIKSTHETVAANGTADITIREFGSNRSLMPMNATLPIGLIFGDAQYPHIFPESYLLERDNRLVGTITNTGMVNIDAYLTLVGRRIQYPEEVVR